MYSSCLCSAQNVRRASVGELSLMIMWSMPLPVSESMHLPNSSGSVLYVTIDAVIVIACDLLHVEVGDVIS